MTLRACVLVAVIATGGALVHATAGAGHLLRPEGGLHQTTGRCLVGDNKEFHTIQSALDFPNPDLGEAGPTCVYVQADAVVWTEQLLITRSVTLAGTSFKQGVNQFTTALAPPPGAVGPVSLVRIVGRKVRVKVKHMIFQGPLTSGDGLIGIEAGKDTRLTIRDSFFFNIQPDPLDGRSGFIGIQVGTPTAPGERPQITYAEISLTRFEGFQNSAVVLQGVGTTGAIYQTFVSAGPAKQKRTAGQAAPVAILIQGGAMAEITRNDIVDARGPVGTKGGVGVALSQAGVDAYLGQNNIDRNDNGVAIDGTAAAVLYRNGLDENGVGIVLGSVTPTAEVVVTGNRIEGGGAGIRLVAGTRNVIQSNVVQANRGVGVALGTDTEKNAIRKNRAHNNGGLGFKDVTTGSDKTGTANTWRSNLCHGNNGGGAQAQPVKLCLVD